MMSTRKATFLFLFATLLWGLTFVWIKLSLDSINPYAFIFYRFIIATLFLSIIYPNAYRQITSPLFAQSFVLAIFLFCTVLFQTIGLKTVDPASASFITGTAVIDVVILSALFSKTWPSARTLLGIGLAIFGLACVTIFRNTHALSFNVGYYWVLACSICFGFYIYLSKHITQKIAILPLTLCQFFWMSLFAWGIAQTFHSNLHVPHTTHALVGIIYCSVLASGIGFTLQLKAQKTLSAHKSGVLFTMEPIFATAASLLVFHQPLTPLFIVGAGGIISSILITQ